MESGCYNTRCFDLGLFLSSSDMSCSLLRRHSFGLSKIARRAKECLRRRLHVVIISTKLSVGPDEGFQLAVYHLLCVLLC